MRSVDTVIESAVTAPAVRGIYFVRLCFDAITAAWYSGFAPYAFDGVNYLGAGTLCSISQIDEQTGVKASGATVGLSGIKEEVVALLIGQPYINRKAYIHFLPLDDQDRPVTATPKLLFRGTMDNISGKMGKNASFSVTLKSRFADWERPVKVLYTDVQQQQLYPGDLGMQYIAQISQKKIIWPLAAFLPDPRNG